MIKRWFSTPFEPMAPEIPFTAIGDLHGCRTLLEQALQQTRGQIICVGDYVDRGPDSAGVLRLLQGRPDIICLMGNHEEMMLNFLDDPEQAGPRWLQFGGVQTLASFGVPPESSMAARDALRAALGAEGETWLRALPSFWQSGNVAVTHAGADPALKMQDQPERALRWGHPKFGRVKRKDGLWVLRGHVVVGDATAKDGVISIDTGAYATGRLSLAHVSADGASFAQA